MHFKFFRTVVFILIGWTLFMSWGCTEQADDAGHKTIRIAANLPMSGPLAIYGQSIKDGAQMAIDDLKRTDPTGPKFSIDWQDNGGDPKKAVSIFQRQMMSEHDIYWSGVKPETLAIKDQIDAKGMPHFVWTFDATLNNEKGGTKGIKNNFRTWVNFKIEPPVLFNYAKERKAKRIAIVYVQLPNTEEEYQHVLIPKLKAAGISDLLVEPYDTNGPDYKTIAVKVRDFKPDLVMLSAFQENYVGLIRAFRPLGLVNNGNVICSYDILDAAKVLGKDELEGIALVAPMFVTRQDHPRIKGWSQRFHRRTNGWPLYTNAFAYDAINIIYDAARRMMLPASSEQWISALQATKLTGVTGPLVFDSDGSLITPIEVGIFKDGIAVPESQSGSSTN